MKVSWPVDGPGCSVLVACPSAGRVTVTSLGVSALVGGWGACLTSRPWVGWAPVSQFCTVVVTGQYSQPSGCPTAKLTVDSAVESNRTWELVLEADQGAVIRCASKEWGLPQTELQYPSQYRPS